MVGLSTPVGGYAMVTLKSASLAGLVAAVRGQSSARQPVPAWQSTDELRAAFGGDSGFEWNRHPGCLYPIH